ncbi:thioredoxin domain-containing protein [Geomonas subterranea]|uniref:Thioredoxin domain-containing protein n=1 Tax=Geomonas subterranea TaxID=2847989 RepID=A0ABX8LL06_9BACT|nr:thioredoxin domain-containing protein [Geomonas subterranea]QXE92720.1 thioredoxin domain-containing protein [Geomonas subterranea]QXM09180.1 thioredoxin domain-containing protein [Geomonas subterranea]
MSNLADHYQQLPGTDGVPAPPLEQFEKLRQRRGYSYRPRTRHLLPEGWARYTNRLFLETSPYLLQHAHNPVNWFPWGEEPFELARQLDRPVLVSIGYATCHWCHVMEEQSFEDETIAQFLNSHFIAIKVDREERPDVDTVYMTAVHAMGLQGGWPLNVFVTADRKPFYGGTYFPPEDYPGGLGFLTLLMRIRESYIAAPDRVSRAGVQLTEAIRTMLAPTKGNDSWQEVSLDQAVRLYRDRFDDRSGGLVGAPKFPSSLPLKLLLRQYLRGGDRQMLSMAELTLERMAAGGIYDQAGGGFHRYATDTAWQVPHFEKMLYDNALLTVSYLEGYQATGRMEFARVAREILQYLQRDMQAPEGAFYSATDADSLTPEGHREEGVFFTWTPEELTEALGRERGELFAACYCVTRGGNFEGRSILRRDRSLAELATELKLPERELELTLADCRELLYRARGKKPLPLRDEKILASWNGLAISAFARAGLILDNPDLVRAATRAAEFLLGTMMKNGRLCHSYQEGMAKGEGFLDDYAFLIAGLIDLFEAGREPRWLERSLELCTAAVEQFEDRDLGGFFMTGAHHEQLISREKPAYDGVIPSGNSVMVLNLLRLNTLTGDGALLQQAERALGAFATQLATSPAALSEMLLAVDYRQRTPKEVVIVAPAGRPEAAAPFLAGFRRVFLPNRVLVVACEGEELRRAERLIPLLEGKRAEGDRAVAYLCENRSCRRPTSDPEEFYRQLSGTG